MHTNCEGSGRRVYVHGCDNRNGEHLLAISHFDITH